MCSIIVDTVTQRYILWCDANLIKFAPTITGGGNFLASNFPSTSSRNNQKTVGCLVHRKLCHRRMHPGRHMGKESQLNKRSQRPISNFRMIFTVNYCQTRVICAAHKSMHGV
jgi:hypothetical protein